MTHPSTAALARAFRGRTVTDHGPLGARLIDYDRTSIIVSDAPLRGPDRVLTSWTHVSMTRRDSVPSYDDLCALHAAVWPDGWAYQMFAPPSHHVNIHPYALHLWGRSDGRPVLPVLSGSI